MNKHQTPAAQAVSLPPLKPGDSHYRAYVGPPMQFDLMGATQFRLLCALGLRSTHYLLDFGCGSLRAGRLFIAYLEPGRYFGIEPNKWLIEEAIEKELGQDIVRLKIPRFSYNNDFSIPFDKKFDFILAQSIFSHTGSSLIRTALANFKVALKEEGLIAATFVEGPEDSRAEGWVYPECVTYRDSTITAWAREAGLQVMKIPWYHPRQTWYLMAKRRDRLPPERTHWLLRGAVFFVPEFSESCMFPWRWSTLMKLIVDLIVNRAKVIRKGTRRRKE